MYEIIRQVIANGGYRLTEMQQKIKRLYILGDLTAEQLDELLALAVRGVSADAERPELLTMIEVLSAKVDALAARVDALDGSSSIEGYHEWHSWDGVGADYQPGAIVSHGGRFWQSVYSGQNVWEPGAVGEEFWVEYEEV